MWKLSPSGERSISPQLPADGAGGHEAVHHPDHGAPPPPHGDSSHLRHRQSSQGKEIFHKETGPAHSKVRYWIGRLEFSKRIWVTSFKLDFREIK